MRRRSQFSVSVLIKARIAGLQIVDADRAISEFG
jgi:hypothetical protein